MCLMLCFLVVPGHKARWYRELTMTALLNERLLNVIIPFLLVARAIGIIIITGDHSK